MVTIAAWLSTLDLLKDDDIYKDLEIKGNRLFNGLKGHKAMDYLPGLT